MAERLQYRPAGAPAPVARNAAPAVTEPGFYEVDEHTVAEVVGSRQSGRPHAKRVDLATSEATHARGALCSTRPTDPREEQMDSLQDALIVKAAKRRDCWCRRRHALRLWRCHLYTRSR
jgi:hypothetical protein